MLIPRHVLLVGARVMAVPSKFQSPLECEHLGSNDAHTSPPDGAWQSLASLESICHFLLSPRGGGGSGRYPQNGTMAASTRLFSREHVSGIKSITPPFPPRRQGKDIDENDNNQRRTLVAISLARGKREETKKRRIGGATNRPKGTTPGIRRVDR